jgi:hypothetical protein
MEQNKLKEIFDYQDGELIYKIKIGSRGKIGNIAGTINKGIGYKKISIYGKEYYAHRLIYLYHYGIMPKMIDHIDRNRSNNKIENLIESSYQHNSQNKSDYKNSKTLVRGVKKYGNKYRADKSVNGKTVYLGLYSTIEEASNIFNNQNK